MIVVNLPSLFDFVHPESAIMVIREIMPESKVKKPANRGKESELFFTENGKLGEVINRIFVIANMQIKKEAAAIIAALKMLMETRSASLVFSKETITAIEKPPSKALMKIVCSASLCQ